MRKDKAAPLVPTEIHVSTVRDEAGAAFFQSEPRKACWTSRLTARRPMPSSVPSGRYVRSYSEKESPGASRAVGLIRELRCGKIFIIPSTPLVCVTIMKPERSLVGPHLPIAERQPITLVQAGYDV